MIEQIFRRPFVRHRMAASHLGIIIEEFVLDLRVRGYAPHCLQSYGQIAEHFSRWLGRSGVSPAQVDATVVERFIRHHLPRCRGPRPAAVTAGPCSAALGCLLRFLRQRGVVSEPPPAPACACRELVAEYDTYLAEVRGLSVATRFYRRRYAFDFLGACQGSLPRALRKLSAQDLAGHVARSAPRLQPASLRVLAVSLRSFLRFLDLTGRADGQRLARAVPSIAPWPLRPPPPTLSDLQLRAFLQSFDRKMRTGRRDYAMGLLLARLGLRTHEVAALRLEDVDWRRRTLRLRQTKQNRERVVPLPASVRGAIAAYLRSGRPTADSRALFVRHHLPQGHALVAHHVRGAMRRAFTRGGIPSGKVHLLRHTLATRLLRAETPFHVISALLGHASPATTFIYAKADVETLRIAALNPEELHHAQ